MKEILIFYSQLKNTKYKIEHIQLNNFKIIYDKFFYSFNLKKNISLQEKIQLLEKENEDLKKINKLLKDDKYNLIMENNYLKNDTEIREENTNLRMTKLTLERSESYLKDANKKLSAENNSLKSINSKLMEENEKLKKKFRIYDKQIIVNENNISKIYQLNYEVLNQKMERNGKGKEYNKLGYLSMKGDGVDKRCKEKNMMMMV